MSAQREARVRASVRGAALSAVCLAIGASAPTSAAAQQRSVAITRTPTIAEATRTPESPTIDGRLDDAAWETTTAVDDFTQRDPNEGEPGTERTEVRILYTDAALYVGVRAWDSQAEDISAQLTRRDAYSPSDWIGIMIDSYYDRRTAFEFAVNPAGVKRDIYHFNDTSEDSGWDAVWDVATSIDPEGWTAEFRIPFSQLRFASGEENRFGFNVYRSINRLNEEQYWKLLPKSESGVVSRFGDLVGIEGITPPRRIEVMPYTVLTQSRTPGQTENPFQTGLDNTASMGLDLNVGVTSNLTLSATFNPDFGQVEADPAVVNLSAFETFFPERRPFFNEGLDIFRFGLGSGNHGSEQLFYSRRVGRRPQGSADDRGGYAEQINNTTILGAAKLSGKANGWTIGLSGALTAEEEAQVIDSAGVRLEDIVEPRSSYLVGRLARDFRNGDTQVGFFGTAVNRNLPDNLNDLRSAAYAGGFDWNHRFRHDTYFFSGKIMASHVRGSAEAIELTQRSSARYFQRPDNDYVTFDPTLTSLSGWAGALNFGKHGGGSWRWETGVTTRSPGFEVNDAGFMRRADQTNQWFWLNKRWLEPGKVFRRFNLNLNQWSLFNHGWDRQNMGGNVNFNYQLANYWNGFGGIGYAIGGMSTGALRGGPALLTPGGVDSWLGIQTDGRKSLRGGIDGFMFVQGASGSVFRGVGLNGSWRPASNIDLTLRPGFDWNHDTWQYLSTETVLGNDEYIFGDLKQTTFSMTFRGNMTFAPTLSLELYAQPFVSAGEYIGYSRVTDPRGEGFSDRFEVLGGNRLIERDGEVSLDLNSDGTADIDLGNPSFTSLSFRSNAVLRWEYRPGSTIFFVWQHGRSGSSNDGNFRLGPSIGDLFSAESSNTFVIKVNYWLTP